MDTVSPSIQFKIETPKCSCLSLGVTPFLNGFQFLGSKTLFGGLRPHGMQYYCYFFDSGPSCDKLTVEFFPNLYFWTISLQMPRLACSSEKKFFPSITCVSFQLDPETKSRIMGPFFPFVRFFHVEVMQVGKHTQPCKSFRWYSFECVPFQNDSLSQKQGNQKNSLVNCLVSKPSKLQSTGKRSEFKQNTIILGPNKVILLQKHHVSWCFLYFLFVYLGRHLAFFQLQLPLRTRISWPRNGAFPSGASRWGISWPIGGWVGPFSLGGEVGKVAFFDVKVGENHIWNTKKCRLGR